ncbi:hypothetical protein JTB14_012680 [Gonioctena quinquepunctata]|nr:hypothetical protein JTB14_012680 [Gonioctena quinquepunctata]
MRIEKARANFIEMNKVFRSKDLSLTLLYGAEIWAVNAAILKKIQSFEMWVYKRIFSLSWTDIVTNAENHSQKTLAGISGPYYESEEIRTSTVDDTVQNPRKTQHRQKENLMVAKPERVVWMHFQPTF